MEKAYTRCHGSSCVQSSVRPVMVLASAQGMGRRFRLLGPTIFKPRSNAGHFMSSNSEHVSGEPELRESLPARLSRLVTDWSGSSAAFWLAVAVVVIWLLSGPFFEYSNTWQLVINTGTTII